MNIRSIDLQVMIPRAIEASRMQNTSDHQTSLQQQQFAEKLKQVSADREQQVQSSPKNVGAKVDERDHQKERQQEQEKKKNMDESQEEALDGAKPGDPALGHRIDIKT
ncbi:MAG: hypothetical protein P4N59_20395 [Negativicutes bacterium]|nr:hypothetical protein [Negativicutes bacterium]